MTVGVSGFLGAGMNVQREGFGSFIQGDSLYHLYHRGSLSGPDYLPSGLLKIDLRDASWTLTEFSQRVGFPKALALFSSQGVALFVDHDKENASNQTASGSWQGGYVFRLDLNRPDQGLSPVTDSRLFWHDLKSDGDHLYAFAFDQEKLVVKLDREGKVLASTRLGRSGGSIEVVGDTLVVAPYGELQSNVLFLDKTSLAVLDTLALPATRGAIHETLALTNADRSHTLYFFHEDRPSIKSGLGYGQGEIFQTWVPPGVRALVKTDLNRDGLEDLLVSTNSGASAWINDGWGRLSAVSGLFPADAFNVHVAENRLIWFDWNGVVPRLNYTGLPTVGAEAIAHELAMQLGFETPARGAAFGKDAVALVLADEVHYLDWRGFSNQESTVELARHAIVPGTTVSTRLDGASQAAQGVLFVSPAERADDATNYRAVGFDRVLYLDGFVAFDRDGVAGQAYRLYKTAFDRVPDQAGLGHWIHQMDLGVALTDIAHGFVQSPEFQATYGASISDSRFLELLYVNALDRLPDQAGLDYWQGQMLRGLSRPSVLVSFSESPENKTSVAEQIEGGIAYSAFIA